MSEMASHPIATSTGRGGHRSRRRTAARARQRTSTEYLLELERVSIRFGGVVAISELDLAIREGEIFGLIGPNGAGKTSTFNIITGVYHPTEGVVRFAGQVLGSRNPTRSPGSEWPGPFRTSASSRRCRRSRTSWWAPTPGTGPEYPAPFSVCPVTVGKNAKEWSSPGTCWTWWE